METKNKKLDQVSRTAEKRAFLPYSQNVSDKIRRILNKYGVKTIFRPPTKLRGMLRSPKDQIPFSKPGVYMVPCSCGKSYIGETKRNIKVRLQEHINAVKNNAVTKSAICEHVTYGNSKHVQYGNSEHEIYFHKAKSLATERFYIPRLVREAIEIKKNQNFNRDQSFKLSSSWEPVIHGLKRNATIHQPADTLSTVCREKKADNNCLVSTHSYHLRSRNKSNN